MSRSDLLIKLVQAGSQNDQKMLERTVAALIAEARARQHNTLADKLTSVLDSGTTRVPRSIGGSILPEKVRDLLIELPARRSLDDIYLGEHARESIFDLLDEQRQADLLRSHSLEPRNKIMLVGPPGNGKTSLAEAIAYELNLPFLVVRYEGIVGSYLGETASRLKRVFDFARATPCVLFLDEFDAIGKERGDRHETGEIKRVVSSLLMQMDELPSYTVLICATNHPELLDRAAWRRFQFRVELSNPSASQIREWVAPFAKEFSVSPATIAKAMSGASFAEIEELMLSARRKRVLLRSATSGGEIVAAEIRNRKRSYRALPGEGADDEEQFNRTDKPSRRRKTISGSGGQAEKTEGDA